MNSPRPTYQNNWNSDPADLQLFSVKLVNPNEESAKNSQSSDQKQYPSLSAVNMSTDSFTDWDDSKYQPPKLKPLLLRQPYSVGSTDNEVFTPSPTTPYKANYRLESSEGRTSGMRSAEEQEDMEIFNRYHQYRSNQRESLRRRSSKIGEENTRELHSIFQRMYSRHHSLT